MINQQWVKLLSFGYTERLLGSIEHLFSVSCLKSEYKQSEIISSYNNWGDSMFRAAKITDIETIIHIHRAGAEAGHFMTPKTMGRPDLDEQEAIGFKFGKYPLTPRMRGGRLVDFGS